MVLRWLPLAIVLATVGVERSLMRSRDGNGASNQQETRAAVPRAIVLPGIENAFLVTERIVSGGQPKGEQAFEALRQLGVTVIISVDGAPPDVETARRYGLRYVHLPIGYDGVRRETALRLIKAATLRRGRIYVHCHHGKHRGPAAAAILARALAGWSADEAERWMRLAGTSPVYSGLFLDVRTFSKPSAQELRRVPADLPQVAPVPPLVEAMVEIDTVWEHLRQIARAGFAPPQEHPDLVPAREARLLARLMRGLLHQRSEHAAKPAFRRMAQRSAEAAEQLAALLRDKPAAPDRAWREQARRAMNTLRQLCARCHRQFRNPPR